MAWGDACALVDGLSSPQGAPASASAKCRLDIEAWCQGAAPFGSSGALEIVVSSSPASSGEAGLSTCSSSSSFFRTCQGAEEETRVLFQSFGWDSCRQHQAGTTGRSFYQYMQTQVPALQAAGVTHVWLPPPSHSISPEGYMPQQLYDLSSSAYGSQQQLQALIADLKAAGISPVADIVINHRCADEQDAAGRWNQFKDTVAHQGPSLSWGSWAIDGADSSFGGSGSSDSEGQLWGGAPNLDHSNPLVRQGLTAWLSWLQHTLGFEGWRFDFAKGYSSRYVQHYVDATTGSAALNLGEVWNDLDWSGPGGSLAYCQDGPRTQLVDWISGCGARAAALDFVSKGVLQEALQRGELWRLRDDTGRAPGLIGWWPERAVTFIDSHDTGSSQQLWPFGPSERVAAGYAYILTHPGVPCVFAEHFDEPGLRGTIQALLEARKRHGITASSRLDIVCADADLYVACVGRRLLVKLGPRYHIGAENMPAGHDWQQVTCGEGFCVWEDRAAA